MALIYLLSALLLGAALVRRIRFPLYAFERVAIAIVGGLFGWTWLTFIAESFLQYDIALPIVVVLSAVITLVLWRGDWPVLRTLEGGRRSWIVWGIASGLSGALLVSMFWTHSLIQNSQGIFSEGASWADYGLHATIVNHINAASSLPDGLPVASGEKMTYPFLIDLLSAMLEQGGFSLHASFFWPGILLAISISQLIIGIGLRLFQRISVGVGALGLTLSIGSAAGTWTFWENWRHSHLGFFKFLNALPVDYSEPKGPNAHLTNFVTDALLPQRSILFGLGVGLVVLIFMHAWRENEDRKALWPAAVLVGLLPLAHPHSFIATCMLFLALGAEVAWRKRAVPVEVIKPFVVALIIAAPQLLWQQTANHNGSGGRFRFGWQWVHGTPITGYWWANFGLMGIALLAIPFVYRKNRQVLWFLPMLVLLFITQIYAFQPFEYDNLKLIFWVYIVGSFFVAYAANQLITRRKVWLAVIVPLAVFVGAPGTLSIIREFQVNQHYQFATNDDIALADWVAANTPINAIFAATNSPTVPAATLAGRTLVSGYDGWLYNFSIPYADREAAVKEAMQGNFTPVMKYGRPTATYLLVPANADPNYPVNTQALASHAVSFHNSTWTVYYVG